MGECLDFIYICKMRDFSSCQFSQICISVMALFIFSFNKALSQVPELKRKVLFLLFDSFKNQNCRTLSVFIVLMSDSCSFMRNIILQI